jgi:hypothetical protein
MFFRDLPNMRKDAHAPSIFRFFRANPEELFLKGGSGDVCSNRRVYFLGISMRAANRSSGSS